jgi:hypothetical protein
MGKYLVDVLSWDKILTGERASADIAAWCREGWNGQKPKRAADKIGLLRTIVNDDEGEWK